MPNFQDWSVGIGIETVFRTPVAPSRWLEFTNAAPFKPTLGIKQGAGIRPGSRVPRAARRVRTLESATGPINLELFSRGLGLVWGSCLSGVSTLVSGATYQQSFKLGDSLPSRTIQFGAPFSSGTISAHTFAGAVVESWELAGAVGDIVTFNASWVAAELLFSEPYVAPSYPATGTLYRVQDAKIFTGAITAPTATTLAVTSGATELATVKSFKLGVNNNPVVDRYFTGAGGRRAHPRPATRAITGELVLEYVSDSLSSAWLAQSQMTLVIRLETPQALSVGVETVEVYLPCIMLDDDPLPSSSGVDAIAQQTVAFTGMDDLTAPDPIVVSVRTADTAL